MRGLLVVLAAGLLFGSIARAADISIMPVGISLAAGRDRAAVNVTNQGQEGVVMQVEAVTWSQVDGEDRYAPSRDLLVNPPLFSLAPGRSQVLRVGLRRPPGGEREQAYRLLLREVPPPGRVAAPEGGQGNVRVLLQIRIPVYVEPAKVVRAQEWRGRRGEDGKVALTMTNTGTVHTVVTALNLRAADAAGDAPPLAGIQTSVAVFPGQSRSWQLQPAVPAQRYRLEVVTDRGPQHVALDLAQP